MARRRRVAAKAAALVAAAGVSLLPARVADADIGDDKQAFDTWAEMYTWGGKSYPCYVSIEAAVTDYRGRAMISTFSGFDPDPASPCDDARLGVTITYRDRYGNPGRSQSSGHGRILSVVVDDVDDNFVASFFVALLCDESTTGECTTRRTLVPK